MSSFFRRRHCRGDSEPVAILQRGSRAVARRIAERLGVTDPTVLNDLRASGAKDLAPPTVIGTDGKGVSYGTTWNDLQVIKTDNLLERRIGADGKRYPTRHRREDSEPENVATIANIRRP